MLYCVLEIEKGPIHPPSWSIDPFTGDAVGPRVVPSKWLEDLVQRFAGVATTIDLEDFNEHPHLGDMGGDKTLCECHNVD